MPPNSLQTRSRSLAGLALVGVLLGGCAKFPAAGQAGSARVRFTFDVSSTIRTGSEPTSGGIPYVYLIALKFSNSDNPTDIGPVPVVAPPWGNGFVAGRATHYVLWDPTAANPYTVYKFVDPTDLTTWFPIGVPILSTPVNQGSRRIDFELDMTQLFPVQTERDALRSVTFNILTMDRVPQSGTSKLWEGLGDGRIPSSINDYLVLSLKQNGDYDNTRLGLIEPSGDVADPQLDVVDWRVQVRLQ